MSGIVKAWRVGSVFVPPLLAAVIAFTENLGPHDAIVGVLVALWWGMTAVLVMRCSEAPSESWDQLDVLTGTGRALMWSGLVAIVLATKTGWASLSVVGFLGLSTACLAAAWTSIVAGGSGPWRKATVERAILPASGTEGDALREQIVLRGVRIPAGMRLFVQGRTTLHAPTTRYCLDSSASGAEVKLESELGPAPRGEHAAPALAMWLGDVLGISHSPIVHRGEARFSAMPKPSRIDGVKKLLADGKDDQHTVPTQRMPTEGSFRIREYMPGDDTRRIYWVRSLQTNQLVVRLPDEIPQAEPSVRLVLDSYLGGTESLTCHAHEELLDALVRVWLGVANALAETGTRVTLVTGARSDANASRRSVEKNDDIAVVERPLAMRSARPALQLGARVAWQDRLAIASMLSKAARQIVVTCRPRPAVIGFDVTYIVVPEMAWTTHGWSPIPQPSWMKTAFPMGSAENRWSRRRAEKQRVLKMWDDRSQLSTMVGWIDWTQYAGSFVARPRDGKVMLEVVS